MTRVAFKANCRIKELTPFLLRVFNALAHSEAVVPLTITSVYDGVHSKNSKHYTGNAVDVRSKNFPSAEAKRTFMRQLLDALNEEGLHTILLEDEGKPNEHFHIQVKKT